MFNHLSKLYTKGTNDALILKFKILYSIIDQSRFYSNSKVYRLPVGLVYYVTHLQTDWPITIEITGGNNCNRYLLQNL